MPVRLSAFAQPPITMAEAAAVRLGRLRKPEPRKRTKGRKDRAEAKVKKSVRTQCVERDGYCRLRGLSFKNGQDVGDPIEGTFLDACEGASQWCHMHVKRRSQTRGKAPDVRHTTAESFMGCRKHHDQYDGRQKPRLFITALTRRGANGPLRFRRAKS